MKNVSKEQPGKLKKRTNRIKNIGTYWRFVVFLSVFLVLFNIIAWTIPAFCDWFTLYITPVVVNTYGRFSNLFPFSIGEVMLTIAVFLILTTILLSFIFLFLRSKQSFKHFMVRYYKMILMIILVVATIMSLNCSVLYHCTSLDPNKNAEKRDYSLEELEILRNYLVKQCNTYCERMERDEDNRIIYKGNMQEEAVNALHIISEEYPKLKGYYPNVKKMFYSDLMSQSYIGGYYFPFSMEANYNGNMYIMNLPFTFCHELAHLHGYIYEDEADFLSYLACIKSEDVVFQYSAYLNVLWYVEDDYRACVENDTRYLEQLPINMQVQYDSIFLNPGTWDRIEKESILDTNTVNEISDKYTDVSLKANGVENGIDVYGDIVYELLEYYDGILY